jgi:hypothetical protein
MAILSRDDKSRGDRPATASPSAPRRSRLRLQPALLALLVVATVEALAWIVVLPPLEGPDEISHFAYTERLVETRSIPWYPGGAPNPPGRFASTETAGAALYGGIFAESRNLAARPLGSQVAVDLWHRQPERTDRAARKDGGYTSAMANPPLYYLYEAIPYLVTYPLDFFDREFAMRVANIPLLLVTIGFAWATSGLLLARRSLQFLATAAVALNPQLIHLTAVVNADIMLAAQWAAFFYLGVRVLTEGATRGRVAGIAALSVASCLTHGRGVAILVPAALVLAVAWWRWRRPSRRLAAVCAAGAGLATVVAGYVVLRYATLGELTGMRVRQLVSYLWQFYLPKLPFMETTFRPDWTVRDAFIDRFYGTFAQLEVFFSPTVMTWLARLTVLAIVLAAVGLAVRLHAARRRPAALWVLGLFAAGSVAYLLDMHVAAFRSLASGAGDPVVTGRYLLPLITIYGLGVALAVSWLPRRASAVAGGVVLGGLTVLQLAAMGILLGRFYA